MNRVYLERLTPLTQKTKNKEAFIIATCDSSKIEYVIHKKIYSLNM